MIDKIIGVSLVASVASVYLMAACGSFIKYPTWGGVALFAAHIGAGCMAIASVLRDRL